LGAVDAGFSLSNTSGLQAGVSAARTSSRSGQTLSSKASVRISGVQSDGINEDLLTTRRTLRRGGDEGGRGGVVDVDSGAIDVES